MPTTVVVTPRQVARAAGPWWLLLVAGIAWLVFAFALLSVDEFTTVWAVAVFAGFTFAFSGASELMVAALVDEGRWLHAVLGVLALAAAVVAFAWPEATFVVLATILAWVLLFKGIVDVALALLGRAVNEVWWLWLVVGVLEILVGFWAAAYSGHSFVLLVVWVAAIALAKGLTDLLLAFEVRRWQREPTR